MPTLSIVAFTAGFLMAFFGSMPPVGPIAVLLLHRGVTGGDREARGIALGAALAETLYCGLAMDGISELMARYSIVETIARVLGVLMLLGLGVHFVRFKMEPHVETSEPVTSRHGALLGLTVSAANPVLIITWSGSIATLLSFAHLRLDVPQRVAFVVGVFCGMFGWFHLFLWMLRRHKDRITLRAAQWSVRLAGSAMIAIGLWGVRLVARSFQ